MEVLSISFSFLFENFLRKQRTWLISFVIKKLRGVFTMSADLLQQLLEVDQKAREQERIHLIQNFFNLGVSVEIIAEATSVSVEDVKRMINN